MSRSRPCRRCSSPVPYCCCWVPLCCGAYLVCGEIKKCCKLLSYSTLLFVETSASWYKSYPEPGSNRHGLPHWCLRPARLPIPPSGHCNAAGFFTKAGAKVLYFSETAKVSDKKMKNTCLYQLFFLTSPTETKAIDIIDGKNRQEKFLCYPRRGPRQTLVAM